MYVDPSGHGTESAADKQNAQEAFDNATEEFYEDIFDQQREVDSDLDDYVQDMTDPDNGIVDVEGDNSTGTDPSDGAVEAEWKQENGLEREGGGSESNRKTDFYATEDGTIISAKKVKSNSQYDRLEVEVYSGKSVRSKNATDDWDSFLGPNQTDIDPRTGQKSLDRIWSADGTRSIRFGDHEMNGMGTKNFHYHKEIWYNDYVYNEVQRIQLK